MDREIGILDTNQFKVVIGMPVFNGEEFVSKAIESLLSQSHRNIELLISDNASTDKTQEICESFRKLDSRVHYFRQERNISVLSNYEYVLNWAGNNYFMWACADDVWSKDWVAHLLPNALDGHTFSFGRYQLINEASEPIASLGERFPVEFSGIRYFRRAKFFVTPGIFGKGNVMYSIFHAKNFELSWLKAEEVSKYGGDTALMFEILKKYRLSIRDGVLMYKRLHLNNVGGSNFPGWRADIPWIINYLRMILFQPLFKNYWTLSDLIEKILLIVLYPFAVVAVLISSLLNKLFVMQSAKRRKKSEIY